MLKTQAKIVLGFVVVLVSIELIYSLVTGQGNWRAFLVVNLVITPVFAVISYIKVRDFRAYVEGRRRVAIEQRNAVIDEAVEALVDDMARLSPGDLSIFVSIAQLPDDDVGCMTVQGSPNHRVYVQMADLGLMKPQEMKSVGDPPHLFVSVQYLVTARGKAFMPKLLEFVAQRRWQIEASRKGHAFG